MSKRKLLFIQPLAKEEAKEARLWYAARNPEAAVRFLAELRRVFKAIQDDPARPPVYDSEGRCRYRLLTGFPYRVIFRELEKSIEVLAIIHTSRKPDYWSERL